MEAYPFLIQSDGSGRRLHPTQTEERPYDEAWLQELIRKYPDALPVAEIEAVYSPLIPIGCEVLTDSGSIDNLFISHRGYLVLVETKLWRNPEAKREVVAQAIDYGSALSKWTYDKLNDAVRAYTKRYEKSEMDLADWVESSLGPVEGGRGFFEDSVVKNLKLGRFLTLIVGDRIRQPVIEMVSYVNKYPGLATDVALVELQCFWTEDKDKWPLLIVPRVIAQTEIVERSVVQVTVTHEGTSQIEVTQEKARTVSEGTKKRVSLTDEAFWELLRKQAPDSFETARQLIAKYEGMDGVEPETGGSSISVKVALQGTGRKTSLFFLNDKARLNVWPGFINDQLRKTGFDTTLGEAYGSRMREILGSPKGVRDLSRPIADVDINKFKAAVDEFILNLQLAQPIRED